MAARYKSGQQAYLTKTSCGDHRRYHRSDRQETKKGCSRASSRRTGHSLKIQNFGRLRREESLRERRGSDVLRTCQYLTQAYASF